MPTPSTAADARPPQLTRTTSNELLIAGEPHILDAIEQLMTAVGTGKGAGGALLPYRCTEVNTAIIRLLHEVRN